EPQAAAIALRAAGHGVVAELAVGHAEYAVAFDTDIGAPALSARTIGEAQVTDDHFTHANGQAHYLLYTVAAQPGCGWIGGCAAETGVPAAGDFQIAKLIVVGAGVQGDQGADLDADVVVFAIGHGHV